jgi:hypothetical protein
MIGQALGSRMQNAMNLGSQALDVDVQLILPAAVLRIGREPDVASAHAVPQHCAQPISRLPSCRKIVECLRL